MPSSAHPHSNDRSLESAFPIRDWPRLLAVVPAMLGLLFLLIGIVFFFAFNWAALDRLSKLSLAAIPPIVLAALAIAFRARSSGLEVSRWLALLTAAAFVVPLALFGQAYQSTADSWTLFALWAALAVPFVFADRFAVSYVALGLLATLTVYLYVQQVLEANPWSDSLAWSGVAVAATGIHLIFLMLQNRLVLAQHGWPARIFAGLAILPVWGDVFLQLLDSHSEHGALSDHIAAALFPLLCIFWLAVFIRRANFDFFYVAVPVYLLVLLPSAYLVPPLGWDMHPGSFVFAFLVFAALSTISTMLLLRLRKRGGL
ncbi:MAG: DUF2157 domain-containing protein [bacterium]|nr:DUF2157 domain-containing protein [bacterium]